MQQYLPSKKTIYFTHILNLTSLEHVIEIEALN